MVCLRPSPRTLQRLVWLGWFFLMTGLYWPGAAAAGPMLAQVGDPTAVVRIGKTTVRAEVVTTPEKLYLGLSGRSRLPWGTGMLFVLPRREVQEFCMRGMLIPIDIIWIDGRQVIGFQENLQPRDRGIFSSPGPADLVLEVPAGFVAKMGVQVGDKVEWRR